MSLQDGYMIIQRNGDQSSMLGHIYPHTEDVIHEIAKYVGCKPSQVRLSKVTILSDGLPAANCLAVQVEGPVTAQHDYFVVKLKHAANALAALYRRQRGECKIKTISS